MKKNILTLVALASLVLTGCGKTASSNNNSGNSSSQNESSEGSSSSSEQPVSDVFNTYKCVELLVKAANKYSDQVTVDDVLDKLSKCGESSIDVSKNSDKGVSEVGYVIALYYTFKDILPEKIGARSFQALSFDADKIDMRSVDDSSDSSITRTALRTLGSYGFFSTPRSGTVSTAKNVVEGKVKEILNRIHYYFGESYVDDFFATVNHDFLYDDNPYQHAPNDGRLSEDEPYDADKLTHIYDSKLIPSSDIADYILEVQNEIPEVKNFIETYSDFDARVAGNAAGLVASLNRYLNASNIEDLIEALRDQVKTEGYCPLWDTAENGNYTMGGGGKKVLMNVTPFSLSGTAADMAPGSSGYNTSVNRFTPIFQEVLGCSETQANNYAKDYCNFKYYLLVNQANWKPIKTDNTYAFLTNDPTKVADQTNGDYYTIAGFEKTGETLYDFFKSVGVDDPDDVMVASKKTMESILQLFTEEHLADLKGLFIWQMLQHYRLCLPGTSAVNGWLWKEGYGNNKETLVDNKEAFYSYVCEYVSGDISNYVTKQAGFDNDSAAVIGVVDDIKNAMRARITAADWLSADAKSKATLKVDDMGYCVGGKLNNGTTFEYADIDYEGKATGSLYENIGLSEVESWKVESKRVGDDWGEYTTGEYFSSMDPLTANAFYAPGHNSIYITLGYMSCYRNPGSADKLKLYSDYGWVVAHEISHGFDSNGIYYDNTGKYYKKGWFNTDDQNAYNLRTKAISNYYDGYEVMPGQATKGATVITEACADINGLHLVMEAAKKINNFDYETFFIKCADHFGDYASTYTYTSQLAADEHPFGRARVNLAMMSIDEWHTAFGTKEGDAMYVAPADRIAIW